MTAFMKRRRFAILGLLVVGICLAGLLALFLGQPRPVVDVCLLPCGMQTNSAGTLCLLVAVANNSSSTYGIGFAAQTKPAGDWADPSLIRHFDARSGETLQPFSEVEVLVPVPQTCGAWRVVVAYYQRQIPTDWLGRYWRSVRMRLSPGHGLKFAATPWIRRVWPVEAPRIDQ